MRKLLTRYPKLNNFTALPCEKNSFNAACQIANCMHNMVDRRAWTAKCRQLKALYEQKNSTYWRNEIAANSGDSKRLWNIFHAVLGESQSAEADTHTADEFAAFFKDKVDSVGASTDSTPLYEVPFRTTSTLEQFTPVTVD